MDWESWPWLLLFIPVLFIPAALVSVTGAVLASSARYILASSARYTSVPKPALVTLLFLATAVAAVLLVTHVAPGVAAVPVVLIPPLLSIAVVVNQLDDEWVHRRGVEQAEQRGKRARLGDEGSP